MYDGNKCGRQQNTLWFHCMMTDETARRKEADDDSAADHSFVNNPASGTSTTAAPLSAGRMAPRIGVLSWLVLLGILMGQTLLSPQVAWGLDQLGAQVWVGLVWAGWAACVWILTARPVQIKRTLLLGLALAWHVVWIATLRGLPPTRYIILLSGFGMLLSISSVLFSLPHWQTERNANAVPVRTQFGIFGIMVITFVVALLMFAIRRYQPDAPEHFLAGTSLVIPMLTGIAVVAIVSSTNWSYYYWLGPLAILGTSSIAAYIMAYFEASVGTAPMGTVWTINAMICNSFGLTLWLVGICGRWDAEIWEHVRHSLKQKDEPLRPL